MDIREQTAGERAAYVRGLDDGARRTRETIAASLAIVATTLEGLAEALGGTAQTGPTPAEALAQDGAEDAMASAVTPSEVEMAAALADAGWHRVGSSSWRRMYTAEAMSTAVAYGTMMAARKTLDETEEARRHA